jgi:hypothetical protein
VIGIPIPEAVLRDRRALPDRRAQFRRRLLAPVSEERRVGRDRRQRGDRREPPTGHLRNALHMLYGLHTRERLSGEAREAVEAATQRLWLALVDVERLLAARAAALRGAPTH